jgi:hypothetical protein
MITGGKIVYVEAKRDKEGPVKGLSMNVGIDDISTNGDQITIQYTFSVNYEDKVGQLKMSGLLFASEDRSRVKEIDDMWKKSKRMPEDFAELVLNTINYTCGVNGTFVVQPVRLSPPMQMPLVKVEMKPEEKKDKLKKAEKGAA